MNQPIPELRYNKYSLKNGLEVILSEDHRLPLVAVNVWYHVGPANERPGLTGFAHLFEHMMFEGSKYVGEKAHFLYLEAAGASSINGSTDFDRTNYFETLPSNQLELALWLESDRMGFLLDELDERKLENQRDVVRNERRQNVESAPYGIVQEELFHRLFPKDHPYHASIMGSHADIEAARLADAREFFRLYYAPDNASLAIVGDIDQEKATALVDKYFGPIPPGEPIQRANIPAPVITSEKRVIVKDQVELPRVYLAWITPQIFTQADAECDLIARILGGGKSSRLYTNLVYKKRVAQDIAAQQASLALGSVFAVQATCKPGIEPQHLEDAIREELENFQLRGPEQAEIDRARNTMECAVIRALETLGGFGGVADRLNLYNHFLGNPGYLSGDLGRYRKATVESLQGNARDLLRRDAGVVVWGVPGQKIVHDVPKSPPMPAVPVAEAPQIRDQDWRSTPPPPGPAPALSLPIPRTFRLQNGLRVFLVEQHNLPVVSANIIALSGDDRNPAAMPGLASFTAEMLDEGTLKRSPLEIAADVDLIGATLATGSSMDSAHATTRTLKRNVDSAFELVSDVLLNPAFALEEIERVRNDRLTHILQQRDNPGILGIKVFLNVVYGSSHPYGFTDLGTEEFNRAAARDMMLRFYEQGYFPENSALVVAGDITESELEALAEKYFDKWRRAGTIAGVPAVTAELKPRVVIVERADASQTVLRIGHVGAARSSPDYAAIEVMNTALGGLFSSRINLNLREKHGYTYGASSAFSFRRGAGPFLVGTSVHRDATAPAVLEIFHEIERMRESEVEPQELSSVKDSIARSLPGLFETTPEIASSIGQLFIHNLPLSYYHDLPEMIQNVSAADVRQAAREYLRPDEAVVVAVGDRSRIEPELGKLNIGPVEIRDSNGNPKVR
jgi:zinc protease